MYGSYGSKLRLLQQSKSGAIVFYLRTVRPPLKVALQRTNLVGLVPGPRAMRLIRLDVPWSGYRASYGEDQQSRLDAVEFDPAENQIEPCFTRGNQSMTLYCVRHRPSRGMNASAERCSSSCR
jgi:hypothetical protein